MAELMQDPGKWVSSSPSSSVAGEGDSESEQFDQPHDWCRSVVESSTALVMVVDSEWRIHYANPKAASFLGHSAAELEGRVAGSVFRRARGGGLEAELIEAKKNSEVVEVELQTTSDKRSWLKIRVGELDGASAPAAMLVVGEDVTEIRDLERRFLHVQKMEAVGRLADGFSHDFNNILTAIDGYCELAQVEKSDRAVQKNLEEIRAAGRRAQDLADKLLVFSKRVPKDESSVLLNEVIRFVRPLIGRLVEENVGFAYLLEDNVPAVIGDSGEVEQVVVNLLVNARDAMPDGGEIHLSTRRREVVTGEIAGLAPGVFGEIEVSDTGAGITPDVLEKMFEPFFSTKKDQLGSGLGLSTVYGIANRLGGCVEVESRPGDGSTFRVLFPEAVGVPARGGQAVEEDAKPVPRDSLPAGSVAPTAGHKVLLVEDDSALRKLFVSSLERFGYQVFSATDGVSALEMMDEHSSDGGRLVDLVVSDLIMPRMGGHRLAKEVEKRDPAIRFILMSGYADPAAREAALKDRIQLLKKPFAMQELRSAVSSHLGQLEGSEVESRAV